jgi:hypothetical protein
MLCIKPSPGTINDISDGLLWSQHPLHDQNPLRLGIYNDAIEYVEAIGAFRCVKKVVHFYVTILNLSPEIRHENKYMILLCSVYDKVLNKNGNICTVVSGVRQPTPNPGKSAATKARVAEYNSLPPDEREQFLETMQPQDMQQCSSVNEEEP